MADPTEFVKALKDFKLMTQYQHADEIKDSEALVKAALSMLDVSTGKAEFAASANNLAPLGQVVDAADGNIDHLTGDSTYGYKVVNQSNILLYNVPVTGLSSIANKLQYVYASDGQTLSLTIPATGVPIGLVWDYRSSGYGDIYLFGKKEAKMLGHMACDYEYKDFGTYLTNALQSTGATTLYVETSLEHYKIISLHAQPVGYDNAAVKKVAA